MPELPEVETIRRGLEKTVVGKTFAELRAGYTGNIKSPPHDIWQTSLPGRTIAATGRRGKYLLLFLDDDSMLVVHLRMTGKLVFSPHCSDTAKHLHLVFVFTDGTCLEYTDVRKFGTLWWLPAGRQEDIRGLATLGPEPLSVDFSAEYLAGKLQGRTAPVKSLLLNQEIIAGLGNIYVDESLHRAAIHPGRPAASLGGDEVQALWRAVRDVLQEAVECRGTTLNDYRDASGASGSFQQCLRVYGRRGLPCLRCGTMIERIRTAGRGTHYCPGCQS